MDRGAQRVYRYARHNLAAVSAASANDAWAVGSFFPPSGDGTVLQTLGEHFDGKRWTAYPLPNVGLNINSLLNVSMLPSGEAWAVGYHVNAHYKQKTLIEHYDGTAWTVVPSPSPGALQNILYGVVALSDRDVWAVGGMQDAMLEWHTLAEHWDGRRWTVVATVDPGATGNIFYAVSAASGNGIYATGQITGTSFPGKALVEQWDGEEWEVVPARLDPGGTDMPLGITASGSVVSIVGDRESSTAPYTTFAAAGDATGVRILSTPNTGSGENDLFGAATARDGSTWAVGWYIDPSTGNHNTLVEHDVNGRWTVVPSPNPQPPAPGTPGDNGLASIAAVPGDGLWVGNSTNVPGNLAPLIIFHR